MFVEGGPPADQIAVGLFVILAVAAADMTEGYHHLPPLCLLCQREREAPAFVICHCPKPTLVQGG